MFKTVHKTEVMKWGREEQSKVDQGGRVVKENHGDGHVKAMAPKQW